MKKLFLASQAKHPESLEKLNQFVGGFQDKKITYIPTAANGDFFGAWKAGDSIQVAGSLGASLEIVELENFVSQDIFKKIYNADILWIAGGVSGYLLYWFRRTELDKRLPEILEKGTIYVGSSAGSMICSKTQYSSEWYLGEPEPGASKMPGLGLVDFEIYPHYEDDLLMQIKSNWQDNQGQLYLLKDGEAITIVNDQIEVLGNKRILEQGVIKE